MRKYDLSKAKAIFKEKGCTLLVNTYNHCDISMQYKCKCGNYSSTTLYNFMNRRTGCKSCMQRGSDNHRFGKTLSSKRRKQSSMPLTSNPNWKGGKYISKEGYRFIRINNHPYANKQGYIMEHRLVMEEYLGRYLAITEVVHHLNGNRLDNTIGNLKLFKNQSEHNKFHFRVYRFIIHNNLIEEYIKFYAK